MGATILLSTPLAGTYPEKCFGESFNYSLWVEFEDTFFNKWYGCFAGGLSKAFDHVLLDEKNEIAFIVAGGIGYVINILNKQLVYEVQDGYPLIETAIITTNPDYFLASTSYSVYVCNAEGLLKEIRLDFFVDGIYLTEQQGDRVIGDLYSYTFHLDMNVRFEIHLLTLEIFVKPNVKIDRWGTS